MSELDNQLTALANAIREIAAPEGTGAMSLDDMATLLGAAEWRNDFLKSLIERTATSITIPSGVTSIGDNAFQGCTNLTDIYCGFAEGAVSGAPWGAPESTTIHYGAA